MKKIPLIAFLLLITCAVAYSSVTIFQVEVDQDTDMYIGNDTTYSTILSGTKELYGVTAKQYTFLIASSAHPSKPNIRIKVMGSTPLRDAGTRAPMQVFAPKKTLNYSVTKSTTFSTTAEP